MTSAGWLFLSVAGILAVLAERRAARAILEATRDDRLSDEWRRRNDDTENSGDIQRG